MVHGSHEEVSLRPGILEVEIALVLEGRFVLLEALLRLRQNVLDSVDLLGHLHLSHSGFFLGAPLPMQLCVVQGCIQRVDGAVDAVLVHDLLLEHKVAYHRELEKTSRLLVLVVFVIQSQ